MYPLLLDVFSTLTSDDRCETYRDITWEIAANLLTEAKLLPKKLTSEEVNTLQSALNRILSSMQSLKNKIKFQIECTGRTPLEFDASDFSRHELKGYIFSSCQTFEDPEKIFRKLENLTIKSNEKNELKLLVATNIAMSSFETETLANRLAVVDSYSHEEAYLARVQLMMDSNSVEQRRSRTGNRPTSMPERRFKSSQQLSKK